MSAPWQQDEAANNVDAVCRALKMAGVEFIPENAGGAGAGLRKA